MAVSRPHEEFGQWSLDGHIPRIDYGIGILEEICADAVEGLYRFRHGGMEVGGVLFGEAHGEAVRILAYRPLECEHAYGPRFVLSERDRIHLKELLYAGQSDGELRRMEPVGWYHSHTRSGVELSPRDLEIYDSYFPQRWQVALVVRPESYGNARAGFFLRGRDNNVYAGPSESEFTVRPRRQHAPPPEPPDFSSEPEREPEPDQTGSSASAAGQVTLPARRRWVLDEGTLAASPAAEPELPRFAQAPPRAMRKRLWLVLASSLVAATAFGVEHFYRSSAPPEPLSLWVADMGGQLLIEWDRTARSIREAPSATLEIRDGAERAEIQIEGDRLHEGSVDYVRRSDIVDVTLRVHSPHREAREFIRFVGPPVRRGPSPEEAEMQKQAEALKAEIANLREQLETKDAQLRRSRSGRGAKPRQP